MKRDDIASSRAFGWVRNRRLRWLGYALLGFVFAILCIFPRPYDARARVVPQDTANSTGTNAVLNLLSGQSQAFASLIGGGRATNDLYLLIGRSDSVQADVVGKLGLVGPDRQYGTMESAKNALNRKVDVRMLLGGVLEIETRSWDKEEAQKLTAAYVTAISRQLALFGSQIITNKQRIVRERFHDSQERLARAEASLNAFRRANNLSEPDIELGQQLSRRTDLQARIQAKLVEIKGTEQVAGPENVDLQRLQTELTALKADLARSAVPTRSPSGPNVAGLSELNTRYLNIFREFRFAQALYDVYARSSEQLAVEELAAASASYVQVIDPAHVDPDRKYNTSAIALLLALVLLIVFVEWYGPATGLLPHASRHDGPLS